VGSTSVIAKADGTKESERGYKAWGEERYGSAGVTSFGFTGQRDSSVAGGIMYYGARFYAYLPQINPSIHLSARRNQERTLANP
jgi:hypothetical protein